MAGNRTEDGLSLLRDGAVARIGLDRPAKKNAFTIAMWQRLQAFLEKTAENPAIRVLILESTDPTIFCAGADLAEFAAMGEDHALRAKSHDAMKSAIMALVDFPKPVLAVINGPCMGAGLAIAAACDLRIAGTGARFSLPPAKLGLVYMAGDLARLEALIGPGQLRRLIFTADIIDGIEAHRIGLVESLTDQDRLKAESDGLATKIAALSPHSLAGMKAMMADFRADDTAQAAKARDCFLAAYDSPDFEEGLNAFRERRTPRF